MRCIVHHIAMSVASEDDQRIDDEVVRADTDIDEGESVA
jgi:hypothetical protein